MSQSIDKTATDFLESKLESLRVNQKSHYAVCERLLSLNFILGVTVVFLSTLTLGFTFGGAQFLGAYGHYVIGGMSVAVGIIAGVQTFADFSGRSAKHQTAAISYGALLREFELRTSGVYDENENAKALEDLMDRWTQISKYAPLTKIDERKMHGDQ